MIHARITRDSNGHFTECHIQGHAGFDRHGRDIVCAAVSVLSINCVNSLESIVHVQPEILGNQDGLLSFLLPASLEAETMKNAQILMHSLYQGLSDIANQYPNYLKVSISNGGKYHDQT